MSPIDTLLAIEEIRRLKARYFRCVDTKDWPGYRAVFADDVRFDISEDMPGGIFTDADAAVRTAASGLNGCTSVHHGHCPEIEILSATTATGIWAMDDLLRWSAESAYPNRTMHGYGHYLETYEKIDGSWLIKTMKLTRLLVEKS